MRAANNVKTEKWHLLLNAAFLGIAIPGYNNTKTLLEVRFVFVFKFLKKNELYRHTLNFDRKSLKLGIGYHQQHRGRSKTHCSAVLKLACAMLKTSRESWMPRKADRILVDRVTHWDGMC